MNEHGRGWTRMTGRGVGRTASLLSLPLIVWWVIAANLGCAGPPVPSIELDPAEVRITEPGQIGTVSATLKRDGKPFEAEQWSTGSLPRILRWAEPTPRTGSATTNIDWRATTDEEVLGQRNLFSGGVRYESLPIRAKYRLKVDEWPFGEGSEREYETSRHLTLRFSAPRIHSTVHNVGIVLRTGFLPHIEGYELQFEIENPWEDALYRYQIFSHAYSAVGEHFVLKTYDGKWTKYYTQQDFESPNRPHTFETKDHFPFEDQIRYVILYIKWQATRRGNVISEGTVRVDVNPFDLK